MQETDEAKAIAVAAAAIEIEMVQLSLKILAAGASKRCEKQKLEQIAAWKVELEGSAQAESTAKAPAKAAKPAQPRHAPQGHRILSRAK